MRLRTISEHFQILHSCRNVKKLQYLDHLPLYVVSLTRCEMISRLQQLLKLTKHGRFLSLSLSLSYAPTQKKNNVRFVSIQFNSIHHHFTPPKRVVDRLDSVRFGSSTKLKKMHKGLLLEIIIRANLSGIFGFFCYQSSIYAITKFVENVAANACITNVERRTRARTTIGIRFLFQFFR